MNATQVLAGPGSELDLSDPELAEPLRRKRWLAGAFLSWMALSPPIAYLLVRAMMKVGMIRHYPWDNGGYLGYALLYAIPFAIIGMPLIQRLAGKLSLRQRRIVLTVAAAAVPLAWLAMFYADQSFLIAHNDPEAFFDSYAG